MNKTLKIMPLGILLSMLLWGWFLVPAVQGELVVTGTQSKFSLKLTPTAPKPFDEVSMVVESFSTDLNQATIKWFVDGKLVKSKKGDKELKTQVGGLGSKQDIRVIASTLNLGELRVDTTIRPAQVELVYQANTYTPPFYKGKALSTYRSGARVIAIPHLVQSNGVPVAGEDLTYTWKENQTIRGDKSGRGRNSYIVRQASIMRGETVVSVDVMSPKGDLHAIENIAVKPALSKVLFYESDPLQGILYHAALSKTYALKNDEVTLQAVPYFFSVYGKEGSELKYAWTQNGAPLQGTPLKQSILTLRKGEESGVASVRLNVDHKDNVTESASNELIIEFGDTANNKLFPQNP